MSTFEKLIEQRKRLKITQREMAKHLKVTPSTLNKYEFGKRKISAEAMDEYCDYLGYELKLQVK
jgi:transcriptional regulator with XRE-family HTH domain